MFRSAFAILIAFTATAVAGALHDAARVGDTTEVLAQLDAGADVNARDEYGETPLIRAVLDGQTSVVTLLIKRDAEIHARNSGGFTALHAASYSGAPNIAALLIEAGANIDDQENKAKVSPLSIAAEQGHADVVRVLIDHGANLGLAEQNGYTPLTRAIWRGQGEVIAVLQEAGAKCQPVEILEEPAYSDCMAGQR